MKIIRLYLLAVLCFLVIACEDQEAIRVLPMVALLSNPAMHDDHSVWVVGYFKTNSPYIFLTKEHGEVNDRSSAVFLNLTRSEIDKLNSSLCGNDYVQVSGRYSLITKLDLDSSVDTEPVWALSEIAFITNQKTALDCFASN